MDITDSVKTISTSKGLYDPSGSFQISLLPMRDQDGLSWYHKLSPMDYVEIRLTRDYSPTKIPIIMRGFIDNINYSVPVDEEGRPVRAYSITGRDFGKILEISYIYYLKAVDPDFQIMLLPAYEKISRKWGVEVAGGDPVEIIRDLMGVAQKQLEHIRSFYTNVPVLSFIGSTSIEGRLHSFSLTQDDGSVWDFMGFFSNLPWNELYVVDLDSGPALVFRKAPWRRLDGSLIQGSDSTYKQTLGDPLVFSPDDIKSLDLTRSEQELKNYYFTYPTQNMMGQDTCFKTYVLNDADGIEDLKSNPYFIDPTDKDAGINRFGFRRFENDSEYITTDANEIATSAVLAKSLNEKIVEAFRYNSAYECGSFSLKGSEKWLPGKYIKMDSGPASIIKPEYYITKVDHTVSFEAGSEQFMSTLEVVRGTGYLQTRNLVESAEFENLRRASGRF